MEIPVFLIFAKLEYLFVCDRGKKYFAKLQMNYARKICSFVENNFSTRNETNCMSL